MRQEDKEIDGPDLERAEERKRDNELIEEREDELYDLDGLPETTVDAAHAASVIATMQKILQREQVPIHNLGLSRRHVLALEGLKTAVEGKDAQLSRFVYAEDRRTLLEQALAILQPEITSIDHLGKPFEDLIGNVGELREHLNVLEDAEEGLVEGRVTNVAKADSDTDDKPDDDGDDDRSLTGPERKLVKPSTSLTGPERKPEPKRETSLTGPERKPEPKRESSLIGSERKPEPKAPTTLGAPADLAAAQKGRR